MNIETLKAYSDLAVQMARSSGKIVRDVFYKEKKIDLKLSAADLVTETDNAVEEHIKKTIKETYPNHKFIGEETASAGGTIQWTDDPTWIIDPIDGTTNFVHSFGHVAVSIAVTVNKEMAVGVVYNVARDQMYTAILSQGAFCNGKPLRVSSQKDLTKSLFITEVGSSRDTKVMNMKMEAMHKLAGVSHGMRCLGSAALNLCEVAGGSVDFYYEQGIHCWDIAAGALILLEAGGTLLDPSGKPFDMMSRAVLGAATVELGQSVVPYVERIDLERDV